MASFKVPGSSVALLTNTSKMPSLSFGLPAGESCPMAVYGENSICGSCYAGKGSYSWAPVKNAQSVRFEYVRQACKDEQTGNEFVALMTQALEAEAKRQYRKGYEQAVFRLHDSGDLFSAAYINLWIRVAQNVPHIKIWCPTRMYRTKNMMILEALLRFSSLDNVVLRPSALFFGEDAPTIPGFAAGSTASKDGFSCPASQQNNECRDCRACWDGSLTISYRKH